MNNSNHYFFDADKLQGLLDKYRALRTGKQEKSIFRGFVFTPGADEKGNQCCFAFPLYSDNEKEAAIADGDIILQNTTHPGCPYPPPCVAFTGGDCYGGNK